LNASDDADKMGEPTRWPIDGVTRAISDEVSKNLDADVIFYNGPIAHPYDYRFIEACAGRYQRANVLLILVTSGGSADSAFRMASWLQVNYQRFTLYVTGRCKSAGTLVAMGAHDLIVSDDHGELGPLDVQMPAPEEPERRRSGLTFSNALLRLDFEAFRAYENFLSGIAKANDGTVPKEYAMKIASDMAVGLYGQTYGQLDPLHVGRASRAMDIASEYSLRLLEAGQNSDTERVNELISDYPSHEFVINSTEVARLFDNVYMPDDLERLLALSLGEYAIAPHRPREEDWGRFTPFEFLSTEPEDDEVEE
ncbi:MAG: hypothetical protein F4Z35_06575, partial [Dehalococcoidia bacterium]|nr:hypothetical protein [Dehalococcoidia bacterium]